MKRSGVQVTDHAIVRYLERHGGFDIPALRQQIGQRVTAAAKVKAGAVTIDGAVFVLAYPADSTPVVVTCLTRDEISSIRVFRGEGS